MTKKKSHKLIVNFSIPYFIFGISSSEKGFVVSNELNSKLGLKLGLSNKIEVTTNGNVKFFELFSFKPDDSALIYSLVSVSGKTGSLMEGYKNLDYFLIVSGTESVTINKKQIILKAKSPLFLAVAEVEINSKKEKEIFQTILQQIWS